MFALEFMRNAYLAGSLISLVCGIVGVFVMARRLSFLTHTLSEIGFSGASFGIWIGIPPLNGMLFFTLLSAIFTGKLGKRKEQSDAATSAVSALFMGLGVLFLSLSNKNSSYATNILFGSIVGISSSEVYQIVFLALAVLFIMILLYRRLKFTSFDPEGAGIVYKHENILSILFLVILAMSVSISAQIVGSLLVFVLITLPAASAQNFCKSVFGEIVFSTILALIGTWLGLYLSYVTNWPVTFFIALFEAIVFVFSLAGKQIIQRI
ncbi:metal ABC transporter permease [Oenococcus oeni]|uniref:ABC-type Mn2+/Zn2+ transport system, permease component n=8 Tax=Oenococcus oeni TaxID=1247 RepID=Q04EP2_OENOB|nr:metal ABC transporter permease [Oenococcus oeni]EAV38941.1 ABC transporter, permease [Oenococcus oeni ATCC BAA-1163]ABJ57080.1 ABC-type Mn2+/Zn2+ transport system, permease component [Oenococcus oeni PSU-1]AVI94366.1 ABC transporter [Oenococcus oeni]AWW99352.1 metal ABC transporter permease [Oenococcus oeni]EFD88348.1 hypothetical protein AWRIB429_1179 [Oenococcus oeni AWRIB429]